MDAFTKLDLRRLLEQRQGPCVSLFMPTHRRASEQDPIRAKNLLRSAEENLTAAGHSEVAAEALLKPLRHVFDDASFWTQQSDGLACFLTPRTSQVYRLPIGFPELIVVGNHFHLKPLLPFLSGDGRFFVLAVCEKNVRLYQGTAHTFDRVEFNKAPKSLAQAMRFHDRDEPLTFHSRPSPGGGFTAIFSGQGIGIDDHKSDLLRFFQQIDRGLHELLRSEHVPLVLASVESLWPIYRKANTYPHLLEQGIAGNPDRLKDAELHERGWAHVRHHFEKRQKNAAALYHQLAGTGRTTSDLVQAVAGACQGRFEIMFVADGQEKWGTSGPLGSGAVIHATSQPGDEDLLNTAAMHTLVRGGAVYAVPGGAVPGGGVVAGIYWLPLSKHSK